MSVPGCPLVCIPPGECPTLLSLSVSVGRSDRPGTRVVDTADGPTFHLAVQSIGPNSFSLSKVTHVALRESGDTSLNSIKKHEHVRSLLAHSQGPSLQGKACNARRPPKGRWTAGLDSRLSRPAPTDEGAQGQDGGQMVPSSYPEHGPALCPDLRARLFALASGSVLGENDRPSYIEGDRCRARTRNRRSTTRYYFLDE